MCTKQVKFEMRYTAYSGICAVWPLLLVKGRVYPQLVFYPFTTFLMRALDSFCDLHSMDKNNSTQWMPTVAKRKKQRKKNRPLYLACLHTAYDASSKCLEDVAIHSNCLLDGAVFMLRTQD